ncbi:MAG TPA: hypothetical protein VMG60_23315 [Burkholderiaceae bacterium]|nr:hypothetical protein [Burkholderiaceae bacterium]
MRKAHGEQEPEPAAVHGLRGRNQPGTRSTGREPGSDRSELKSCAESEQEREDRDELARDERADQQVRGRLGGRRYGQEFSERIAAAPDERLDVDLQNSGERKGT